MFEGCTEDFPPPRVGASGVRMGTAFLSCEEAGSGPLHREALLTREAGTTALTRGFTGRLARGIRNRLLDELNREGAEILPYPLQTALVRHLSAPAERAGRRDLLPMWAGQSARLSRCEDVHDFLSALVAQVFLRRGFKASANERAALTGSSVRLA